MNETQTIEGWIFYMNENWTVMNFSHMDEKMMILHIFIKYKQSNEISG
jgi:phage-related protein